MGKTYYFVQIDRKSIKLESATVLFLSLGNHPKRRKTARKVGGGLSRKNSTAKDDRYIVLQGKKAQNQSASAIAEQLCIAKRRQVLQFTVARRPQKSGLFVHRPENCTPLKAVL
ncbi:hypothetical protein TNCV_1970111 [Trichonephila clavipes]|nr:hypothetical protein TNCV_1970111 [Trichonephila clavipes]